MTVRLVWYVFMDFLKSGEVCFSVLQNALHPVCVSSFPILVFWAFLLFSLDVFHVVRFCLWSERELPPAVHVLYTTQESFLVVVLTVEENEEA